MTLLVQHRSQFPSYVTKIAETRGGVNVAAPICFNPGHMTPTTNLTDPYCLADFLVPMRARVPGITQHPIIQMAKRYFSVSCYDFPPVCIPISIIIV